MKVLFLLIVLQFSACSFFKKQIEVNDYVTITTEPAGAEVFSSSNVLLGKSPLKLGKSELQQIENDGVFSLVIKKINYNEKHIIFKNPGVTDIKLTLKKTNEQQFKEMLSGSLSTYVNDLVKRLIQIQENILTRKYDVAQNQLSQLSSDYPNLASVYVLEAAVDIQKKNFSQAKVSLEKALSLDQTNELAKSYLNYVKTRIRDEQL